MRTTLDAVSRQGCHAAVARPMIAPPWPPERLEAAPKVSFKCVEAHFPPGRGGAGPGDVSDAHGNLGIVCYHYSPLAEVIRAAEAKGVRLVESDLVNDEAIRINEGVVSFRGATAQLVDAIYDRFIGREAIEEMLKSLRSCNLPLGGEAGEGLGEKIGIEVVCHDSDPITSEDPPQGSKG